MRKRGFAIIEILIAIFLLAICIALLAQCFPVAKQGTRRADDLGTAVLLGQQKMEELLVTPPGRWNPSGSFEKPFQRFEYRAEVLPWSGDPRLNRLRVEIHSGGRKLYDLETLALRL